MYIITVLVQCLTGASSSVTEENNLREVLCHKVTFVCNLSSAKIASHFSACQRVLSRAY